MKAKIVIGLGYGDEGKGLTTDYLCSKSKDPIVIRFSGGQQAGHTVMFEDMKHIHSNFGAGTLRGTPSYFSEYTTIYPNSIVRELNVLKEKGLNPVLMIHPLAKLTTPFDVFANRRCSDNMNHGTCGLGIGKTMKRNESPYKLYAMDMLNDEILCDKMESIARNYYSDLDLDDDLCSEVIEFFQSVLEIKEYDGIKICDYDCLYSYSDLIFEGSQGVLLDMDFGVFPNVTYSNTTSKNAHSVLDKLRISDRELFYVTRCYHSRHGNGSFKETDINLVNNQEETCVYNDYQKEFRVGDIDFDLLNQAIRYDNIYSSRYLKNIMVTCLDQLENFEFDYSKLPEFNKYYESYSPFSKNIIEK